VYERPPSIVNLSDCVAALLRSKTLNDLVQGAKSLDKPTATKAEADALLKTIPTLIDSNNHKGAVATTLSLILLDAERWLAKMRREGMFRASRYGFNAGCLRKVVTATLALATHLRVEPRRIDYLKSVLALLELAGVAKQLRGSIVHRLTLRRGAGVKTLLAIVNAAFANDWPGDREQSSTSALHWSATELASAFSRLYMIFREELGIKPDAFHFTDDLAGSSNESAYLGLLADAAALNEMIDAEVMVDGLPYKAEVTATGVLVSAFDSHFERSVRLGYIQTDQQFALRVYLTQEENNRRPIMASFRDGIQALLEAGLLEHVRLRIIPMERLVFELPDIPPLFEMLRKDAVFVEELPLIQGSHIDNFHPAGEGFLQVSGTLTTMDLFKVQRLFSLIELAFGEKLKTIDDEARRNVLALRSTVMVLRREDLRRMLELILAPEKSAELISLLSLPTSSSGGGSDAYIDLQYRPFLHAVSSPGEFIAIPPAVVARSNLVRSVQYTSSVKRRLNSKEDPMQVAVVAALSHAGFLVKHSVEFNISGRRETDIFAYRDGALFVFECKNAYHPCSPHELRNSFDLLETSQRQLDIRADWLSHSANQACLFKAIGWAVEPASCVYTCTVTANRCFTGYKLGAHPVRQAHELMNVLTSGHIGRGPNVAPLRFWRSEAFQVGDLIDYLEGTSVVGQQHAAMHPVTRSIDIRGRKLDFAQFAMNLEKAAKSMAEAWPSASAGFVSS